MSVKVDELVLSKKVGGMICTFVFFVQGNRISMAFALLQSPQRSSSASPPSRNIAGNVQEQLERLTPPYGNEPSCRGCVAVKATQRKASCCLYQIHYHFKINFHIKM